MGQTLENGVYLPSEGERNCYAGLKTNWEILDQKVADVTALQQAVAGALHREIVESLPTTDIDPNTIYMVLSGTSATENVYNEYMYVNNAWELIGTSATDLTNYYTKSEVDGKLLLKANASDLTSHTGDTTIHVTTADKNRWNNNTYVFRYSSTALVASSTNSNALLDNTDNLKVGDKVIDSSGVLFSITAIDTQNSTFTIGSALVDLALDANVVHTSGNETVGGVKTFSDDTYIKSLNFTNEVPSPNSSSSSIMPIITTITYGDSSPAVQARLNLRVTADGIKSLYPHENNQYALGLQSRKWSEVRAIQYYYGSSDTEFSDKFVTTDTNQTINGTKTFNSDLIIARLRYTYNVSSPSSSAYSTFALYNTITYTDGSPSVTAKLNFRILANGSKSFYPEEDNQYSLGLNSRKWTSVTTYAVNGLNPGSLSLPDLSNGIDISGYITDLTGGTNNYTPLVDGYISLCAISTGGNGAFIKQGDFGASGRDLTISGTRYAYVFLPVVKNIQVDIVVVSSSLGFVKFYPNLGNV